ncbi:hypothetical protein [Rhodococcus sp. W8901]|uniref:hypothetical protein n=1 Tax=Rhodococcus sp. W8901 TaxID=2742603 RepID=UPI001582A4B5|nr:hypothetical protein [Rhodococcus sp. W8901]QKT13741.1 hypothetical protein HUN07_25975 [Rhodococcus sp. W8901]
MTGPRRVNFAYVGPPPKEWTAHLKWSARILRLAGEEVPEQELLAELDREDRELQTRRPVGHRVLPDSSNRRQSDTYARRVFSAFDTPTARLTSAADSAANATGAAEVRVVATGARLGSAPPSVSRSITAAG